MILLNGSPEDFADESVEALLARRHLESRGVAVAIDGDVVSRSAWATTKVPDGSHVEIVTAAAGG